MLNPGDKIKILDLKSEEILETFEVQRVETKRDLPKIGYYVIQVVDKEHKPLLPSYKDFDPFGRNIFFAEDEKGDRYFAIPWAKGVHVNERRSEWGFDLIRLFEIPNNP